MSNQYVGFAAESTYGTWVAPSSFLEVISENLRTERAFDNIETFRGFSTREIVELNRIVRGDMEVLANYEGLTWLFRYLIGASDTTDDGGGNYTWTFPGSSGIPAADREGQSLAITVRRDDSLYWNYGGMKPISFGHSFGVDAAQRMTVGWVGKDETTDTTGSTASYPTLKPMDPADAGISFDANALAASSVQINIENPVDELRILGSKVLGREPVRNGVLRVTFTADAVFENFTAFYDSFDGVSDVDVQISSSNGTESIIYNFNKCRILQATPAVSGRDRLIATIEGESFYNTDATENVEVVLLNTDTTDQP